jgi:hypothetical protein
MPCPKLTDTYVHLLGILKDCDTLYNVLPSQHEHTHGTHNRNQHGPDTHSRCNLVIQWNSKWTIRWYEGLNNDDDEKKWNYTAEADKNLTEKEVQFLLFGLLVFDL